LTLRLERTCAIWFVVLVKQRSWSITELTPYLELQYNISSGRQMSYYRELASAVGKQLLLWSTAAVTVKIFKLFYVTVD